MGDGAAKIQTASYVPFSKSDTELNKRVEERQVQGAGNTTPGISRIPSDADAVGVSPLTVATDDDSPRPSVLTEGAPMPQPPSVPAAGTGSGAELTPGTIRTHLPSGNTPLP